MSGADWQGSEAESLVDTARRFDIAPQPGARARVWAEVERRQRRPMWRFAWPAFAAGAACASLVTLLSMGRTPAPSATLALVDLAEEGRLVASPGTTCALERSALGGERLRLGRGSVLLRVKPRRPGAPLYIETPAFVARVVGTVLRVVVHGDGRSSLAVGHGAVEVTPIGGAPVLVRTGERWPAGSTDAPAQAELDRLGAADLEGATVASFSPPQTATVATPAAAPAAQLPTAEPVAAEPAHGGPCASGTAPERLRCRLTLAGGADALAAESALYEAGWIALRDLGRPVRALALWERERARFPHGVLARDVQTSIVDALLSLGRTQKARAEISDYLRAQPNGLRAGEMHFVLATLYRDADGSCRRARHEVELALKRPAAPWADRARLLRDRCAESD